MPAIARGSGRRRADLLLHELPTWATALLVGAGFVGLTLALFPAVNRFWPVLARHAHNDIAGFIIAVVGVLYAVLLASIAILALQTWSEAESAVEREAAIVGDVYRDVAFLPPEIRDAVRADLRAYAQAVLHEEWSAMRNGSRPEEGWPFLERLQSRLFAAEPATRIGEIVTATVVSDLDALYDARRERILVGFRGVEPIAWVVLVFGAAATLAFSLFFGVENVRAHMAMTGLLAVSLALVVILIIAVDQPLRGDSQIAPDPFRFLLAEMDRLDAAPK